MIQIHLIIVEEYGHSEQHYTIKGSIGQHGGSGRNEGSEASHNIERGVDIRPERANQYRVRERERKKEQSRIYNVLDGK